MRASIRAAFAIALLLCSPAAAQTASTGDVIWIMRPAAGNPPERIRAVVLSVELRCTIQAGRLAACAATQPQAEGYEQSAIEAAGRAHIAAEDTRGASTEGREIVVAIGFPIPVAINPPPAPPSTTHLTHLVWLERPSAEDFVRYYPEEAGAQGINGRATIECIVGQDGRLSCRIVAEDPPGYGFGEATLRVARKWRLAPTTSTGEETAGGRVRRTVRWRAEEMVQ